MEDKKQRNGTQCRVSKDVLKVLNKIGRKEQSYDGVIRELLTASGICNHDLTITKKMKDVLNIFDVVASAEKEE